jgi:phenylpyruvate tautomerase PptA (4-oxalocrotonate tautomerase family)
MATAKIYGLRKNLEPIKAQLSDIVQACFSEAIAYPVEKRFHRFFNLEESDFYYPNDRSDRYIIIEIMMLEGRSIEAKKKLIKILFAKCEAELNLSPMDLEIIIFELPKTNWGFRGLPGDEHQLNYQIEV